MTKLTKKEIASNDIEEDEDDGSDFWKELEEDYRAAVRTGNEDRIITAYAEALCMGHSEDDLLDWRLEEMSFTSAFYKETIE